MFANFVLTQRVPRNFSQCFLRPTLEGAGRLLSHSEVLLRQMVHGLVLVDLHTGAHVALTVQEEGEGAGQVLTVRKKRQRERDDSLGNHILYYAPLKGSTAYNE